MCIRDSTYIEQMYHVMALQDYLAEYALRLTQATLEQENTLYSSTATRLRHLPLSLIHI